MRDMSDNQVGAAAEPDPPAPGLDLIYELAQADTEMDVYEWAIECLSDLVNADMAKVALAREQVLVPIVSTSGGNTGRAHAAPIPASIPGSVYTSGEGCVIGDLREVRGAAAAGGGASSDVPEVGAIHRSMICVPIRGLGVLVALSRAPEAFTAEDRSTATTIGNVIAEMVDLMARGDASAAAEEDPLLDEVAHILSHDLSNKLAIASGRLELAEKTGKESHFSAIRDAHAGIEAIAEMVLELARSGDPIEELSEVALEEQIAATFRALDEPDVDLDVKASATIVADPHCLGQLLDNLFRNAVDHANGPVTIEVGLMEDGFYIADDGPGIPEGIRDELFEPGVSAASGHQGLGLAIVNRLAAAHGWTVTAADSDAGGARIEIHGVEFS